MSISDLPAVNAGLNSLTTLLLIAGRIAIHRRRESVHRGCMLGATVTSVIFLASYLAYHAQAGHTVFRDPAWFRPIYLTILLTHTLLAAVIVPLVLASLYRAMRGEFDRHRRVARWTWPLWMYVSVTGVLIYWLLYHRFPQA